MSHPLLQVLSCCFISATAVQLALHDKEVSSGSCLAQRLSRDRAPAHFDHDGLPSEVAEKYPISTSMLEEFVTMGDVTRMSAILQKLAAGRAEGVRPGDDKVNDVRVLTIGGSFTKGEGCKDDSGREGHECSWVTRVHRWLQKSFPNTDFTWYDKAKSSTPTGVFLSGIGALVRSLPSPPDLIFIDTLVNDACEPTRGLNALAVSPREAQSAAYEALLRTFMDILPNAQILIVEDACPTCISAGNVHTQVAEHYDIPIVNFAQMAKRYNRAEGSSADRLWPQTEAEMAGPYGKVGTIWPNFEPQMSVRMQTCCTTNHPPWVVHQYLADSVGDALTKMLEKACDQGTNLISKPPVQPFWPQATLNKFASCSTPLSYYSSADPVQQPTLDGDWQLMEDKKGRPGWIATKPGSTIVFPVKLQKVGALTISFLTSYEGVGHAMATLNPRGNPSRTSQPHKLDARVGEHFSQVQSKFFGLDSMDPGGLLDCPKDASDEYELRVTIPQDMPAGKKFKLVEVSSC